LIETSDWDIQISDVVVREWVVDDEGERNESDAVFDARRWSSAANVPAAGERRLGAAGGFERETHTHKDNRES
jgi:hypothetical protein